MVVSPPKAPSSNLNIIWRHIITQPLSNYVMVAVSSLFNSRQKIHISKSPGIHPPMMLALPIGWRFFEIRYPIISTLLSITVKSRLIHLRIGKHNGKNALENVVSSWCHMLRRPIHEWSCKCTRFRACYDLLGAPQFETLLIREMLSFVPDFTNSMDKSALTQPNRFKLRISWLKVRALLVLVL